MTTTMPCPVCKSTGRVGRMTCTTCKGDGVVQYKPRTGSSADPSDADLTAHIEGCVAVLKLVAEHHLKLLGDRWPPEPPIIHAAKEPPAWLADSLAVACIGGNDRTDLIAECAYATWLGFLSVLGGQRWPLTPRELLQTMSGAPAQRQLEHSGKRFACLLAVFGVLVRVHHHKGGDA